MRKLSNKLLGISNVQYLAVSLNQGVEKKQMKKLPLIAAGSILAIISSAVYAYSVIDQYDHGSTVQIDLRCDSGSKKIITYYKKTGEYCTPLMSCSSSQSKVARWACNE